MTASIANNDDNEIKINADLTTEAVTTLSDAMNIVVNLYEAGGWAYMDALENLRVKHQLTPTESVQWFETALKVRRAVRAAQEAQQDFEVRASW